MRGRLVPALVATALALVLAACSSTTPQSGAKPNTTRPARTYVAIGGSESTQFGGPRGASRSVWTQLVYRDELGTSGTFYDFSEQNETVAAALETLVPDALAVRPNLVSVWLGTADLLAGNPASSFGLELTALVRSLRGGGSRTVLLANLAPLERLPGYARCVADPRSCGVSGPLPSPAQIGVLVAGYDAQVATVAAHTGAVLVDVHGALLAALGAPGADSPVAPNGDALSPRGEAVVAAAFESGLSRAGAAGKAAVGR